jgi:hypothetical protein
MDKISEFFKEIMSRLRNPLVYSFIITWLIINWRIPIGLVFYTNASLHTDGYSSFFDLIEKNNSIKKFLLEPLVLAILYTGLFPVIRTWIMALHTYVDKWGTDWFLKISKEGQIPMTKYIEMRTDLKQKIAQIEELVNTESVIIKQKNSLLLELSAEKNKNIELIEKQNNLNAEAKSHLEALDLLIRKNSVQYFDGNWSITYALPSREEVKTDIKILNGEASMLNKRVVFFRIERLYFSPVTDNFVLFLHFLSEIQGEYYDWEILSPKLPGNFLFLNENNTIIKELRRLD